MTEIEQIHHNPLTALGPHAWHWEIVLYLFLGGLAAGLMILSVLVSRKVDGERSRFVRYAPFAAVGLLSVGMLALFLDLEYRTHAYRFYLAFEWTSPMSWGSWILLAIYPASLLLGLGQLGDEELQKLSSWGPLRIFQGMIHWSHRLGKDHLKGLRWTNLLLGIALGGYTGVLLSSLGAARPVWNSAVLAPLFLVSGVSTGAALLMLFSLDDKERNILRGWDLWAIVLELALLGLFLLGLSAGGADVKGAADLLLGGRYTAIFWSLVVVLGLLVPFIVETFEARLTLRHTLFAPVLLLVGGFALRWVMVNGGQTIG